MACCWLERGNGGSWRGGEMKGRMVLGGQGVRTVRIEWETTVVWVRWKALKCIYNGYRLLKAKIELLSN